MKTFKSRVDEATFELNLAPMLDIIVSIVPMLLLSVAFIHVTVIDTPIPQAVEKAIAAATEKTKDQVQVSLYISKGSGFKFVIQENGAFKEKSVGLKDNQLDLSSLHQEALTLKREYPEVFRLELHPEEAVPLAEIVAVMDQVRAAASHEPKVNIIDEFGKPIETNLLFPDIIFGNVAGG